VDWLATNTQILYYVATVALERLNWILAIGPTHEP
jgi:hypothetical protein